MTAPIRVAIIGASGYTGLTLLRLIDRHPMMKLIALDSPSLGGQPVCSLYPHYRKKLVFTKNTVSQLAKLEPDLVFTAMPNGEAMKIVPALPPKTRIVDLAADYRFSDLRVFYRVYKIKHTDPRRQAVYGLPEINRREITDARVIGNPGCYVTASLLSALPLTRAGLVEKAIFDGKSGWSGAGRHSAFAADPGLTADNLIAYKMDFHRHRTEIESVLQMPASFSPQVLPTFRGILITTHLYLKKTLTRRRTIALYKKFYRDQPFVKVLEDRIPTLHDVQGTNLCLLGAFEQDNTGRLVIVSVIDNLLKGASGQALQNANLMFGFEETTALSGLLTPRTKP